MKHHLLIADSGSTKTDWAIDGQRIKTQGINPFHQDEATIRSILKDELLPQIGTAYVESIQFYGSGVRPELQTKMQQLALPKLSTTLKSLLWLLLSQVTLMETAR